MNRNQEEYSTNTINMELKIITTAELPLDELYLKKIKIHVYIVWFDVRNKLQKQQLLDLRHFRTIALDRIQRWNLSQEIIKAALTKLTHAKVLNMTLPRPRLFDALPNSGPRGFQCYRSSIMTITRPN